MDRRGILQSMAAAFSFLVGSATSAALAYAGEGPVPVAAAVHINRTPAQSWPGYGIYLGQGLVLTASHVVGQASLTKPRVVVDGIAIPATIVKEGSFTTVDLTLLAISDHSVPAELKDVRVRFCESVPEAGHRVVVVTPEAVTETEIVAPEFRSIWQRLRFATLIKDEPGTGNSGSGVFDPDSGCLLGIITLRLDFKEGSDITQSKKYFIPFSLIQSFLPPGFR